jgi:hypothetical protein
VYWEALVGLGNIFDCHVQSKIYPFLLPVFVTRVWALDKLFSAGWVYFGDANTFAPFFQLQKFWKIIIIKQK